MTGFGNRGLPGDAMMDEQWELYWMNSCPEVEGWLIKHVMMYGSPVVSQFPES